MITARDIDLLMVEVESFIEKMIIEYAKAHLGDRIGEVGDGELYDQEGRQPGGIGEEMGSVNLTDIGR